jgi:RNA polymerase sigma-70 factor, ECF subfamily
VSEIAEAQDCLPGLVSWNLSRSTDSDALNSLFISCLPQLRRTAIRMMENEADSEDALQNALMQGFRSIHTFRGCAKFSTWMHSILVNSVRSLRRKNRHEACTHSFEEFVFEDDEPQVPQFLQSGAASPEEVCLEDEQEEIIGILLRDLPEAYREAVWMREVAGFEVKEIATQLGIGFAAAKARVHRGRRLMLRAARIRGVGRKRRCSGTSSPSLRAV